MKKMYALDTMKKHNYMTWFVMALFVVISTYSQAFTPSAAQIEQFKNLPKAQQEALAQQYGVDLNAIKGASNNQSQELNQPAVVVPNKNKSSVTKQAEQSLEKQVKETEKSLSKTEDVEARVVKQKLEQFGYDLFAGTPTTFAPATDIPVPTDYVIGPGDVVKIQLFGKTSGSYEVVVDRDGTLTLPELDIISVIGSSFDELKQIIADEYQQKTIGIRPVITLGKLRSIRIFVLGEANNPGSYTVSSLTTLTNALFVSGGISKLGSLRSIQLKRSGKVVTGFDLYDLLLKGDTSKDARLMPGDVIFIPPIGQTAGIRGEVKRPAIYELKKGETIADLIKMAGGYLATAYPQVSRIERIVERGDRTVLDVDLTQSKVASKSLKNGDIVEVFSILDRVENVVQLKGHVQRPGAYAWQEDITVSDLISNIDQLLPKADLNYGVIVREQMPNREVVVKTFKPRSVLFENAPVRLEPRDTVYFFGIESERVKLLSNVVDKLKAQERANQPAKITTVVGNVRHPGTYPWFAGMTVKDLLIASFEAKQNTDYNYAIIERKLHNQAIIKAITLNLNKKSDILHALQEEDRLYIFDIEGNRAEAIGGLIKRLAQQTDKNIAANIVSVFGDVQHPGVYPLSEEMTVTELVAAAGGFLESAYIDTAEITRFLSNRVNQAERIHLEVNLRNMLANKENLVLESRDVLHIKRIPEWRDTEYVTVEGEFLFPGRYEIKPGDTLKQLISRVGGFTKYSDPRGIQFSRESLREKENKQVEFLKQKLKEDLTEKTIENMNRPDASKSALMNEEQLELINNQLDNRLVQGRMALDIERLLKNDDYDIELRGGDRIRVPKRMQEVSVIGQVQQATSHLYNPAFDIDDYIERSGGETQGADMSRIYVIKSSGEVVAQGGNRWFSNGKDIEAGDTIVIPLDADRVDKLTLWTSISQVVYQFGLAAAVVNSL